MEGLKAQTIAILSYIDPIAALLFSALILKESLSVLGLAGAVMILGAAIVSEFERKKRKDS
jgi:drug/metabolite transporter (DMT)-like permease